MDILTKPLNTYSFEEIESFVAEKIPEGDQIDYKREFPKAADLSRLIAAYSNFLGGVVIVGVECDQDTGLPISAAGITNDHHEEFVAQVMGNVSPIPNWEFHQTNEKTGKVICIIRVFEGDETPYRPHNDGNIWMKVGSVKKPVEIASPEATDLLFRKSERAATSRMYNRSRADLNYQSFLKNAERERVKERESDIERETIRRSTIQDGDTLPPYNSNIINWTVGDKTAVLKILLQPYYPHGDLLRPLDIEPVVQDTRTRNNIHQFPLYDNWKSMSEGMICFDWDRNDGGITCQQIFANGLIFSATDVRRDGEGKSLSHLAWYTSSLYVTLKGASKIYERLGYRGSIIGSMQVVGVRGLQIYPVIETMFPDNNKSIFDVQSWDIDTDTRILADDVKLKEFITELSRDIHWSFGYKDLQKKITVDVLEKKGYTTES